MATIRSAEMKTPLARLSFPNLLKPQVDKDEAGNTSEKYNCVLLFPKSTDISALKKAVAEVATQKWGDKAQQWIKDGLIKHPFLDGDGSQGIHKKSGERHEGYAGCTFIRCSTTIKPKVVDRKVQPVVSDEEIYPGCYVYAVVSCYVWENDKNGRGVSFGISMVQVAKDGERLGGGGADPSQHFEANADEGNTEGSQVKDASDLFN
jgi:hypothetical protein